MDLADRHVVVTGAAGGLGGAVVDALLAAGATCHLPQRRPAPERPGVSVRAGIDLTDEAAVTAYYASLPPLWASVHLAGGWAGAPFTEVTLADLRRQLDVNLVTAFLCAREAARKMRGTGGRIVNVASRGGLEPSRGQVAYAAAKAGVVMMTRGLALELEGDGILVNAIAPATIDTAANRAAMPGADRTRWARPEDIAPVIAWMLSPRNVLVSGAIIPV